MARNYDLNDSDYDTIYNNWSADAHEKYSVDFNGCWYKNETEDEQ